MSSASKKQTPASQLAKTISKSRQTPSNATLPSSKQSHVVRTHQEMMRQKGPYSPGDVTKTKHYKSFARKWTATIVAIPIVIYTSYALYHRVLIGRQPQGIPGMNSFESEKLVNEYLTSSGSTSPKSEKDSKPSD